MKPSIKISVIINDVFDPGDRSKVTSPISLFSLIYYLTCGRDI
ncbi:MAG TPA: hypothetical protein VK211_12570 [Kamptonema sp.]|nr:hypothetical protein [Kamptonema sp.]